MNFIRKNTPNALTCMNLAFGCYACILGLCGNFWGAMVAIWIAAGFDFVDGLSARLLKSFSPIGKDLDSLSDQVSFGVAPGMMLFHFLDVEQKALYGDSQLGKLFLLAAFAIPIFSALRLAKFNNDDRQTTSFIGLPVPAHALFWSSLLYVLLPENPEHTGFLLNYMETFLSPMGTLIAIAVLAIGSSLLLVSEIPMFSLKFKSLAWKGNELRYILVIAAVILIVVLGIIGITATILFYVLLSIFNDKK